MNRDLINRCFLLLALCLAQASIGSDFSADGDFNVDPNLVDDHTQLRFGEEVDHNFPVDESPTTRPQPAAPGMKPNDNMRASEFDPEDIDRKLERLVEKHPEVLEPDAERIAREQAQEALNEVRRNDVLQATSQETQLEEFRQKNRYDRLFNELERTHPEDARALRELDEIIRESEIEDVLNKLPDVTEVDRSLKARLKRLFDELRDKDNWKGGVVGAVAIAVTLWAADEIFINITGKRAQEVADDFIYAKLGVRPTAVVRRAYNFVGEGTAGPGNINLEYCEQDIALADAARQRSLNNLERFTEDWNRELVSDWLIDVLPPEQRLISFKAYEENDGLGIVAAYTYMPEHLRYTEKAEEMGRLSSLWVIYERALNKLVSDCEGYDNSYQYWL